MDLVDYLRVLRRRWLVIAAAGLVALIVGIITMPLIGSTADGTLPKARVSAYKATSSLLQTSASSSTVPLSTLPVFVASGDVPKAAAKRIGYDGDPNLLAQQVTLSIDDKTTTVGVTAVNEDPVAAVETADAFSDALIRYLRNRAQADINRKVSLLETVLGRYNDQRADVTGTDQLADAQREALDDAYRAVQQQITELRVQSATAGFDLDVLQAATAVPVLSKDSESAVTAGSSNRLLRLAVIVAMGLLLGAALALGIERFDTRLRGRKAFEDALRLPVVASVPTMAHRHRGRHEILAVTNPQGGIAEAHRSLRSAMSLLPSRPVPADPTSDIGHVLSPLEPPVVPVLAPTVILLVSPRARDGKTTSLVNLAATLVEAGRRVIVLDCDFRNPEGHLYLDVPQGQGLSDLLAADKNISLESVLQPTSVPGVQLALAGTSTAHPGALLGLMQRYVHEARTLADIVLIDAPPVLLANDAIDLMPFVDSVGVVARDGRTTRAEAQRVAALLARLRVPCLGTVLIASSDAGAAYFGQGEATRRRTARRSSESTPAQETAPQVKHVRQRRGTT